MKNFIIIIFVIGSQFIFSCSHKTVISNNEEPEETLLYYDLNKKFFLCNESYTAIDTFLSGSYPIWLDSKTKIGYHSSTNLAYYIIDPITRDTLNSFDITGYGTFIAGRYSEFLEEFIFQVDHHGLWSIGIMDWEGNVEIISLQHPISNPVCSGVDSWIYYLKNVDGTNDVYRIKSDGSSEEQITNSLEFNYSNFSISFDGEYIVVPKFDDNYHYIAIIDTDMKNEVLIDLSQLNLVGFTSFSKDNKSIYFTGDENRNLYKINFDGTDLKQITNTGFLYRPLTW